MFEYDGKSTRSEEVSEEAITNAIINVSRQGEKTVYFLAGARRARHRRQRRDRLLRGPGRAGKTLLQGEGAGLVPGGGRARGRGGGDRRRAAEAAPREGDLPAGNITSKQEQGRLLLLLDPFTGAELKPLLAKYGLALEENVVVDADPLSQFMGGNYFMPVVAKYPEHAITKGFGYATMFPLSRGLARVAPAPAGVRVDFLAATSPNSWGETRYEEEVKTEKITRHPEDKGGPMDIAAACEAGGGESEVAARGLRRFRLRREQILFFPGQRQFFQQCRRLAGRGEGPGRHRPQGHRAQDRQPVSQSAGRLVFFYTLIILPLLVFAAGIGVWLYRRKL